MYRRAADLEHRRASSFGLLPLMSGLRHWTSATLLWQFLIAQTESQPARQQVERLIADPQPLIGTHARDVLETQTPPLDARPV